MDGAQATDEHGVSGMSVPEMDQRSANGSKFAPKLPIECQKMPSSEISTDNSCVGGGCADYF